MLVSQSDVTELLRKKEYLYGYGQLALMLGVCRQTSYKLAAEKLKDCYFLTGKRKPIFDKLKVIERLKELTV